MKTNFLYTWNEAKLKKNGTNWELIWYNLPFLNYVYQLLCLNSCYQRFVKLLYYFIAIFCIFIQKRLWMYFCEEKKQWMIVIIDYDWLDSLNLQLCMKNIKCSKIRNWRQHYFVHFRWSLWVYSLVFHLAHFVQKDVSCPFASKNFRNVTFRMSNCRNPKLHRTLMKKVQSHRAPKRNKE